MAGYFRKLNGYVYDGAHAAGAALTNGLFVELDSDGAVVAATADKANTLFRVVEKTTLWNLPALVLDVISAGDDVYMVENDFDTAGDADFDETEYTIAKGELVKMRRPVPGDQIVVSVASTVLSAASVNAVFQVASGGSVKKKTVSEG